MVCIQLANVAGPCVVCREYQMAGMHVIGLELFCAAHCPQCSAQASIEWGWKAETVSGEQEEMRF